MEWLISIGIVLGCIVVIGLVFVFLTWFENNWFDTKWVKWCLKYSINNFNYKNNSEMEKEIMGMYLSIMPILIPFVLLIISLFTYLIHALITL